MMRAVPLVLMLAVMTTGCASQFDLAASDLKYKMTYKENTKGMGQLEKLSEANNWTGDCSNYTATLDDIEGVRVWYGELVDGRQHAIACQGLWCYDTIEPTGFRFNPEDWKSIRTFVTAD